MKLDNCRLIALDEADRLLDLGFDEELGDIMNNFNHQRQNLLFSVRAWYRNVFLLSSFLLYLAQPHRFMTPNQNVSLLAPA